MRAIIGRRALCAAALAGTSALAACGGGGGVQSTPTPVTVVTPTPTPTPVPTPTPTPVATPTPTPTPASYDTVEYRQTLGAVDMNALAAYQQGATGAGITVGIVDTGIDLTSMEFGTRISAASQNVAGGTGVQDQGGHGTAVAFTLAGRRNGTGTHGVAFDATLVVERADTPGTCTGTSAGSDSSGCSFSDDNIARGVDAARIAGARVINMSLGGSSPSGELVAAVNRATAAGIVIVIAAGNDGTPNPDPFAEVANTAAARGLVVIAGSVNAPVGYQNTTGQAGTPDTISTFSDRAGDGASHYITAVGTRVAAPDNTGTGYLWTGTSFSAPQVSAAVALLAQAFPNLTGVQIVSILFSSARDAGDPGVDAVYGNGILDLTKAFSPLGTMSLAGGKAAVSASVNGVMSAPMGDAQGTLGAVILDGYSRAFAVDLARTIHNAAPQPMLTGALSGRTRNVATALGSGTTLAVTLSPRVGGGIAVDRTTFSQADARSGVATAALVTQRMGAHAQFAFGMGYGGAALVGALVGEATPAFLVAADPRAPAGFDARTRGASAFRQELAGFGLTAAAESGEIVRRDLSPYGDWRLLNGRWHYGRFEMAVDRRIGGLVATLGATRLQEGDTVLGARLGDALGSPHATSWFVDAGAQWRMGGGWSLGASRRQGWTLATARGGIQGAGTLRTAAWSADVGKDGVFGRRDSLGLRLAQPLRVAGGGIDYRLPTGWNYDTGAVADWTQQRLNLAPTGRELDVEARYAHPLGTGDLQTNLFWRRDPGNIAALAPDYGVALRWGLGF